VTSVGTGVGAHGWLAEILPATRAEFCVEAFVKAGCESGSLWTNWAPISTSDTVVNLHVLHVMISLLP
jgi:hypothetical protein